MQVLGIELKSLSLQGKHFTSYPHSTPLKQFVAAFHFDNNPLKAGDAGVLRQPWSSQRFSGITSKTAHLLKIKGRMLLCVSTVCVDVRARCGAVDLHCGGQHSDIGQDASRWANNHFRPWNVHRQLQQDHAETPLSFPLPTSRVPGPQFPLTAAVYWGECSCCFLPQHLMIGKRCVSVLLGLFHL